jgi:hypothetical protein
MTIKRVCQCSENDNANVQIGWPPEEYANVQMAIKRVCQYNVLAIGWFLERVIVTGIESIEIRHCLAVVCNVMLQDTSLPLTLSLSLSLCSHCAWHCPCSGYNTPPLLHSSTRQVQLFKKEWYGLWMRWVMCEWYIIMCEMMWCGNAPFFKRYMLCKALRKALILRP